MWERLGTPTDNPGVEAPLEENGADADNGGSVARSNVHTQSGLNRNVVRRFHLGNNNNWNSVGVATIQMGDRSAREPMKVVPSRDITPGRRKEPLNRGLPNGTSFP